MQSFLLTRGKHSESKAGWFWWKQGVGTALRGCRLVCIAWSRLDITATVPAEKAGPLWNKGSVMQAVSRSTCWPARDIELVAASLDDRIDNWSAVVCM